MIEKFAASSSEVASDFLDLNPTSKFRIPVFLLVPKFAPYASFEVWRTSESGH
jgi:hypothetical protein